MTETNANVNVSESGSGSGAIPGEGTGGTPGAGTDIYAGMGTPANTTPTSVPQRFSQDWVATLPSDLQELVTKYEGDPITLLKAFRSSKEALSKRQDQYTDADWDAVASHEERVYGIPKDQNGYEFRFEKVSEYSKPMEALASEDFTNVFRQAAHELKLSKDQAQGIFSFMNEISSRTEAYIQNQKKENETNAYNALQKEWGKDFQQNIGYAERAFKDTLPKMGVSPEVLEADLSTLDIKFKPEIMKVLAAIGRLSSPSPRVGYSNMSQMDAKVQLDQLINDKNFMTAFANYAHKDHAEARKTYAALHKKTLVK
jgi:hypothetical protein